MTGDLLGLATRQLTIATVQGACPHPLPRSKREMEGKFSSDLSPLSKQRRHDPLRHRQQQVVIGRGNPGVIPGLPLPSD